MTEVGEDGSKSQGEFGRDVDDVNDDYLSRMANGLFMAIATAFWCEDWRLQQILRTMYSEEEFTIELLGYK